MKLVMAMIGSAVTGALEAGATAELVAFAFQRAMKGERDWDDNVPFSDWRYGSVLESIEASSEAQAPIAGPLARS